MALQQCSLIAANDRERWQPQLDTWEQQTREAFLAAYDEQTRGSGLYASLTQFMPLLRLFELEEVCAELQHALLDRPDSAGVPLRALAALAG
jgi:predicted trehalose synthase